MTTLWIVTALVAALAGFWLALPFLRKTDIDMQENASKMSIYRDQLAEIERDLADKLLSEQEAEAARQEIEMRTLKAAEAQDLATETAKRRPALAAFVFLLVGGSAVAGYAWLGNPGLKDQPLAERRTETLAKKADAGDINSRIQLMIERTKEKPDSFESWWLLARSYASIGDNKKAANAYQKAAELSNNRPEILSAYAESMTLANGNKVPTAARLIFEQVLNRVNDPRARYYIALAKAQSQKFDQALEDWALLAKESDANAPWMRLVRRDIVNMARLAKKDVTEFLPDATDDEIAASGSGLAEGEEALKARVAGLKVLLQTEEKDYKSWIELFLLQARLGNTEDATQSLADARENFAAAPFILGKIQEAATSVGLDLIEAKPVVAGPSHEDVAAASQMSQSDQNDMIAGMVAGLAAKLEDNPNNPDGWVMLVRSYRVMGDAEKAEDAFAKAKALFGDQPKIWEQIEQQATEVVSN